MNITENNKLIAEFMCENNPYTKWNDVDSALIEYDMHGVIECISDGINQKNFFTTNEMLFHISWNWLMPVVQKIREYKHYQSLDGIEYTLLCCLTIDNLYIEVVEFIKEYNKLNN